MALGAARRSRGKLVEQRPEVAASADLSFNWPPTEQDLAEFQAQAPADTETLTSGDEVVGGSSAASATWEPQGLAWPWPWPWPGSINRAHALGAAILLGLALACGAAMALLNSPRASIREGAVPKDTWKAETGAPPARDGARPKAPAGAARPPDVTVIAEYSSTDVRAPRGMLRGGAAAGPAPTAPRVAPSLKVPVAPGHAATSVPTVRGPSAPETPTSIAVAPPALSARGGPASASPAPPVPAASAPAAVSARSSIERLLQQYRTAYQRLDAKATSAIWPSVDTAELERAFQTLSNQELTFARCDIKVAERTATAACNGELRYVRRVGGSSWQRRAAAWTFDLSKAGDSWTIRGVRAR